MKWRINKRLTAPWNNRRRLSKKRTPSRGDKIGWNHAYNKRMDMQMKGHLIKRKWKYGHGKKVSSQIRRKRYYLTRK